MIKDAYIEKYNLRFAHSPKTAWTSLRKGLDARWTNVYDIPADARVFSVLRNPYDRAISIFKEVVLKEDNYGPTVSTGLYWELLTYIRSAKSEVEMVARYFEVFSEMGSFDAHMKTQVDSMRDRAYGRQDLNIDNMHLIDFSHLNAGMSSLLGEEFVAPHFNQGAIIDANLFKKYRETIEKFYQEDIRLYQDAFYKSV